jgi:hypothetical protein
MAEGFSVSPFSRGARDEMLLMLSFSSTALFGTCVGLSRARSGEEEKKEGVYLC